MRGEKQFGVREQTLVISEAILTCFQKEIFFLIIIISGEGLYDFVLFKF